jgi:hypothetical protein
LRLPVTLGLTAFTSLAVATSTAAATCGVDLAAVKARIADLEGRYGLVISTVGCIAPYLPAHRLICTSAEDPKGDLWHMVRLDDLAWLHAVENGTGQGVTGEAPPRDTNFLAIRDACTDAACLCVALIDHTNASLGGTSPYPQ